MGSAKAINYQRFFFNQSFLRKLNGNWTCLNKRTLKGGNMHLSKKVWNSLIEITNCVPGYLLVLNISVCLVIIKKNKI